MLNESGMEKTVPALLAECAVSKRTGYLFADDQYRLSAADVLEEVSRLANGLYAQGLRKGDRVAFIVGGSLLHANLFLACLQIGLTPCAMHARDSTEHLAKTFTWLGASALVGDDTYIEAAQDVAELVECRLRIFLGDSSPRSYWLNYRDLLCEEPDQEIVRPTPQDVAYIILSSGTTGAPKGVVHTHASAFESAMAGAWVYGDIGESDKILMSVAPSFAAWVNILLPFIAARSSIFFHRRFDAGEYLAALDAREITYAALPPTLWRLVLREVPKTGIAAALRYVFFSGERGSQDLIRDIGRVLPQARVRSAWLSSEGACGAGIVADHGILVESGHASATGRPVPGAMVRIAGPDGSHLGVGEVGELVVSSRSVADHYWNDPDLTSARLTNDGWFTGDVGFRDEHGLIHVTGRTDNVINTGGIKVHAEEVEDLLLSHPDIAMCAVIGEPDDVWGCVIHAYVVVSQSLTASQVDEYLRFDLNAPGYKIPKAIHFVDSLPLTATGKLFRRGLLSGASPT